MNTRLQKIRSAYSDKAIKSLKGSPSHMSADEIFLTIASTDPTPQYKYVGWLMKQLKDFRYEDVEAGMSSSVGTTLHDFERLKKRLPEVDRSLMKHKTLADIWGVLEPLLRAEEELGETIGSKEAKRRISLKAGLESFVLEADSGLKAIIPLTKTAAQHAGHQTRWCTSARSNNLFSNYHALGPLIILVTPENKKYQLHLEIDNLSLLEDALDSVEGAESIMENSDFLNSADKSLTANDADILQGHMEGMIEILNETAAMHIPDQDTGSGTIHFIPQLLETYLEMARQNNDIDDEYEDDEYEGEENAGVGMPQQEMYSNRVEFDLMKDMIQNNKESVLERYKGLISDVVLTSSLVGMGRHYSNDVKNIDSPSTGLVCTSLEAVDSVLSKVVDEYHGNAFVLLPPEGADKSAFYKHVVARIMELTTPEGLFRHHVNTANDFRAILTHCISEEPSVLTDLVKDIMQGFKKERHPAHVRLFFAFDGMGQSDLNNILGNFAVREDDIYTLLDTIRHDTQEILGESNDSAVSEVKNVSEKAIFLFAQRAIITSKKSIDLSRVHCGDVGQNLDDKYMVRLFENYVENIFDRMRTGGLKQKDAVKSFESVANLDRGVRYAIATSEEDAFMKIRNNAVQRKIIGAKVLDKVMEKFPTLNPDVLFRESTPDEMHRFTREHISDDLEGRLDDISFFGNDDIIVADNWINNSSDEIIAQNKMATLSHMIPNTTQEAARSIENFDAQTVLRISEAQIGAELEDIFQKKETADVAKKYIFEGFNYLLKEKGFKLAHSKPVKLER